MDALSDQLLAGSALSGNEHSRVGAGHSPNHGVDFLDQRMFTNGDSRENFRELENLIEQLVILKEDTVIHPVDLPTNIFPSFAGEKVSLPPLSDQGVDLKHILEQIETQLIHGALYSKKGNVSAAAQMLRLKRTTLVAKLRKFKELEKRDSFSPTRVGQFSNALICPREKVV